MLTKPIDQHGQPGSQHNRVQLFKKWLANKPMNVRAASSPYDVLHPTHKFKGAYYHFLL